MAACLDLQSGILGSKGMDPGVTLTRGAMLVHPATVLGHAQVPTAGRRRKPEVGHTLSHFLRSLKAED